MKVKEKKLRCSVNSEDKSFARSVVYKYKHKHPHMQWINGKFCPQQPSQPPMMHIKVSLMQEAHKAFGIRWSGSRKGAFDACEVQALSDTGCQTCTAGEDLLDLIGCPKEYMVPTKHRIMGITEVSLGIIGAVLLRIEYNGKITRQMIYISTKVKGFFLSEDALKELGVIHKDFPRNNVASAAACSSSGNNKKCNCPSRADTPDRPVELPMPATPENVGKLREWLVDAFKSSGFNTCTYQPLQDMSGEPMDIQFRKGCQPVAVHTPIPVPHHWKYQTKADIDRDVRLGIIEPVPQGTPTTWCSRMVVTSKKDGTPRRTVDLQQLNKATLRETHHTPSPFNLVSTIPPNTLKTVLDAWNGYHSLCLAPSAKNATTFITEWGRYRYCRAPMGFHASGDAYTRRYDDITVDQQRVRRCIDDAILWDDNIEEAFFHTFDYIKLCADNGIVFNEDKFVFAQEIVDFAGFEITESGYRPPKHILEAIQKFPTPTNITDVRSWFGLINQVAYSFSQAQIMKPFRELLSGKGKTFYWDEALNDIFAASKEEIIHRIQKGVRSFDTNRVTCLLTDWSKVGLGFLLMQKHCQCQGKPLTPECGPGHWQLVYAGSRFTTDVESRYAPIEGEALSLVHGLISCRMFVLGCPQFVIAVDHKPLIKVFNDRSLDSISNPRLLKLKEKTLMYNFKIEHITGKNNCGSDAFSRNPVGTELPSDGITNEIEFIAKAYANLQAEGMQSVTWTRVTNEAACDEECRSLVDLINAGFPKMKSDVPEPLHKFWQMRDELYVIENVPFLGQKMLIPKALRKEVLEGLHVAHQGVCGMSSNASRRLFWPGINAAIKLTRSQCKQCNENAPSQPQEPLLLSPSPEFPFQQVVTDLFSMSGHDFLVFADRYSGWLEVAKLHNKAMKAVQECFLRWFTTFGVPEEMSSDGGPPFNSSTYIEFLKTWDVRKRQSSVGHPQSNGRAEVAVKSAKRILLGNIDPITGKLDTFKVARALLTHRNTPAQDTGVSPAMVLFGNQLRDHLPCRRQKLRTEWQQISDAREVALSKRHTIDNPEYNQKPLRSLEVGQSVQIQNQRGNKPLKWSSTGIVTEVLPHRQYRVVVDGSRRITLRNRRYLRPIDSFARRLNECFIQDELSRVCEDVTPSVTPATSNSGVPNVIDEPMSMPFGSLVDSTAEMQSSENTAQPQQTCPREMDNVPRPHTANPEDDAVKPALMKGGDAVHGLRRSTRERTTVQHFSPKMKGQSHD